MWSTLKTTIVWCHIHTLSLSLVAFCRNLLGVFTFIRNNDYKLSKNASCLSLTKVCTFLSLTKMWVVYSYIQHIRQLLKKKNTTHTTFSTFTNKLTKVKQKTTSKWSMLDDLCKISYQWWICLLFTKKMMDLFHYKWK